MNKSIQVLSIELAVS